MFEKIKEKIMPWVYGVVCAVVCGAVVMAVLSFCSAKSDITATVTIPDIKIYIRGEIKNPGLYEVGADVRLVELIEIAGGATENADLDRLNLAAILTDGTTVTIPAKGSNEPVDPMISVTDASVYETAPAQNEHEADKITSGTININSASKDQLMRLPGVGESTAAKIISYREQSGGFMSAEEIMNVSGVGEKTFEKMKQFITVE